MQKGGASAPQFFLFCFVPVMVGRWFGFGKLSGGDGGLDFFGERFGGGDAGGAVYIVVGDEADGVGTDGAGQDAAGLETGQQDRAR